MFQNINIRENHVEVGLVLPWKNHIYIDYTVSNQWPPSSDNVGPNSSPMSVPGTSGPWLNTGCGSLVHYSISIEGEFLALLTHTIIL
jgi:hypothetical protein